MGQQDVYDFLKKRKAKWFTSKEICQLLELSIGSVTNSLRKLRNSSIVHYKSDSQRKNMFLYKYKR
ncbi:hypothetical protein KY331_03615 [Candidatus Woesearchaeota archaeon]|nr:hypothetical protein [Candidatus Woesearchaeota archaeon]